MPFSVAASRRGVAETSDASSILNVICGGQRYAAPVGWTSTVMDTDAAPAESAMMVVLPTASATISTSVISADVVRVGGSAMTAGFEDVRRTCRGVIESISRRACIPAVKPFGISARRSVDADGCGSGDRRSEALLFAGFGSATGDVAVTPRSSSISKGYE